MIIPLVLLVLGFLFAAFFAGAETAFIIFLGQTHSRKLSRYTQFLISNPARLLTLLLVGTNVAIVTASASSTHIFESLSPVNGELFSLVFVTAFTLIFCEIIPKNTAINHYHIWVKKFSPVLCVILFILYPFLLVTYKISNMIVSLLKHILPRYKWEIKKEELLFFLEGEKTSIPNEKLVFMRKAFELEERTVSDYARSLTSVPSAHIEENIGAVVKKAQKYGISLLPVYQNDKQDIIGIVDIVSIFTHDQDKPIKEFVRPLQVLREDMRIKDLLAQARNLMPLCAIVDKSGRTVSLFLLDDFIETLEDLLIFTLPR